ncbi:MAG: hypothetical protein J6A33_01695 [Alphaproteobacteria bacterium]|nr:hypothetical protein [Alphaproteobacteria bacterium]
MVKRKFSRLNELGSLMVEAMAMLALISMVTPILYKKAAERTTELQDINAASQMRSLIKSIDDYVKDNYDDLVAGKTITQSECNTASVNYSAFTNSSANITVPINHFCYYLPYGFLGNDKEAQDSKTFSSNYKVVLKKVDGDSGRKKTITAFLVANPSAGTLPMIRASRIASMVGSNGGYVDGNRGNGVQGIWTLDNLQTDLGLNAADYTNGAIMASSMQSISASGGGDSSENVLYRNKRAGKEYLNTMETDLSMGEAAGKQYNIKNINQLIVGANSADTMDGGIENALYLKKGGINVGDKAKISSNGAISGTSLGITGGATIGGALSAASATISGALQAATANITGNLTVGGSGTFGGAITGASLDVGSGAIKGGPITGTSLNVGTGSITAGNGNFSGDITAVNGNFSGTVNANLFEAPVITATQTLNAGAGGAFAQFDATSADINVDTFKVGKTSGSKISVTDKDTKLRNTTTMDVGLSDSKRVIMNSSGVGITSDALATMYGNTGVNIGTSAGKVVNIQTDLLTAQSPSGVAGAKGLVKVRDDFYAIGEKFKLTRTSGNVNTLVFSPYTTAAGDAVIYASHTDANAAPRLDIKSSVLQVDSGPSSSYTGIAPGAAVAGNASKGSVYIRNGVIELRSQYDAINQTTSGTNSKTSSIHSGYIKADRFVDNAVLAQDTALPLVDSGGYTGSPVRYDAYQVNPAYTSVMHDIKLTTRGGARLSDILPDFINKGIYVVDNTYKEAVGDWSGKTTVSQLDTMGASSNECGAHTCRTSPWLGWIPTPQCPPGYGKVITITPAGWAMAQAGTPGKSTANSKKSPDLAINYDPRTITTALESGTTDPTPLYFQKSTWLRANVFPHGDGASFVGWSAIMGFMYPFSYYKDYATHLGFSHGSVAEDRAIIWNLFPVFKQQLEAYATVYCYFDRDSFNDAYVSDYDQLVNKRTPYNKADTGGYVGRLNDPKLPYTDPW